MRSKISMLAAAGAGYAVGAAAGRRRDAAGPPGTRPAAPTVGLVKSKVTHAAPVVVESVREKLTSVLPTSGRDETADAPDRHAVVDPVLPDVDVGVVADRDDGLVKGALAPEPTKDAPVSPGPRASPATLAAS